MIQNEKELQEAKDSIVLIMKEKSDDILYGYFNIKREESIDAKSEYIKRKFLDTVYNIFGYINVFRQDFNDNKNNFKYQKNEEEWYSYIYKIFG